MDKFILSNLNQIVLLFALLVMSATFSGCETALFSLKYSDLNKLRKSKLWLDSLILSLYNELPEFLLTILLGNMIVNILYFAVATLFVQAVNSAYGRVGSIVFGIVSFGAVLIVGEIAPKSSASVLKVWFARVVIIPVYYIHKVVLPVRVVLQSLLRFFERIINIKHHSTGHNNELTALLELERNRGTISSKEAELLESVIELPEIKVGEIMTHRVDVYSVTDKASIEDIIIKAKESGHNKIPVRSCIDDEYIAWIDARDLFFACSGNCKIVDFYRKFNYISVYDRADVVLDHFVQEKNRMALVLDERGSSAGILVVSDVLSELFGDFGDEESLPEELAELQDDGSYILDGRLSIRDLADLFSLEVDSLRSNTIGGLITDILGRSAIRGDRIVYEEIEFTVVNTFKRRIQKVIARIDVENTKEDAL